MLSPKVNFSTQLIRAIPLEQPGVKCLTQGLSGDAFWFAPNAVRTSFSHYIAFPKGFGKYLQSIKSTETWEINSNLVLFHSNWLTWVLLQWLLYLCSIPWLSVLLKDKACNWGYQPRRYLYTQNKNVLEKLICFESIWMPQSCRYIVCWLSASLKH